MFALFLFARWYLDYYKDICDVTAASVALNTYMLIIASKCNAWKDFSLKTINLISNRIALSVSASTLKQQ